MDKANDCTSDILMTLVTVIIQGTHCSVPSDPSENRSRLWKSKYLSFFRNVRNMVVKVNPNCLMECCVWPACSICNILEVKHIWQWVPRRVTGNYDATVWKCTGFCIKWWLTMDSKRNIQIIWEFLKSKSVSKPTLD